MIPEQIQPDPDHFPGRIYVQPKIRAKAQVKKIPFEPVNIIGKEPIRACNIEEFIEIAQYRVTVLRHSIKQQVLDLVLKGMKLLVISRNAKVLIRKLEAGHYSYVRLSAGYMHWSPAITCAIEGYYISDRSDKFVKDKTFIKLERGDYVIKLGDIIKVENY